MERNRALVVKESEPLITPPDDNDDVELPDMEPILQRLLQVHVPEPVYESVPEPEETLVPVLSPDPELDIEVESVLQSIRRINLVELSPAELIIVPVSFGSQSQVYEALVDTGAEVNLLLESVIHDLQLETKSTGMRLKGLGQGSQVTVGMVSLSPILHGRRFPPTTFYVVPLGTISEPVVFGCAFLKENGIQVDCPQYRISVPGPSKGAFWEVYAARRGKTCHQVLYGMNVIAVNSVKLTCSEPTLVPVTVHFPEGHDPKYQCPVCEAENPPEMFYDGFIINEGLSDKATGVPGIMSLEEQSFVLVKGLRESPAWVKKGEVIGKAYSMLRLDPTPSCLVVQKENEDSSGSPTSHIAEAISELSLAEDVSPEQQDAFRQMLRNHLPVISTGDDDVGECSSTPIRIQLYDETPIYQRVRRFSSPITDAVELQCKELCNLGIIEPSISPWSSPIVPVIKPDKSIRLCVDYRKLNKVTVPDRFPMPNLSDSVFSLHGIQYFTSLDLVRGYYQLPLAEESKEFTAFSTAYGHWQFKRLSFGLRNAPAVFQREMQRILQEFPKCRVIVYIDDILILGRNFVEHLQLVDQVLSVLQEHGLKIKISKCSWVQPEVKYLGHLVGRKGMRKLPRYIQKVEEFPRPTTIKELRGFLGLVNFQRKYIPMCSTISKPLSSATGGRKSQGNKKINWTDEMESAFVQLKTLIREELLLSYPDYSINAKPLELYVDASGEGAGACLCQEQDDDRVIIAYDSMTFLDCETRYSTIERELAALRWGVKTFRSFLYGQFFIIHTDHRPLMYLQDMKMIDSRLSRTLEELSEFDFIVKYCPGDQNVAADWLSRLPGTPTQSPVCDTPYSKLPAGLKVNSEMKGGPDSLIDSLVACLELLYEELNKSVESLVRGRELRELMVEQFLKDSVRLGFKLNKADRNRIKAMKQPGCVPALELLLAVSKLFAVEVWVHFGPTSPVVFSDPTVHNLSRIHIQSLAGVHFNPVMELKNFLIPSDVIVACKFYSGKSVQESGVVEEQDIPEVPVMYTAEITPVTLSCQHCNSHPAQCVVFIDGIPCCALIDSAAQVSLVSDSVFHQFNFKFNSSPGHDILEGLAGKSSKVLGSVFISLSFGSDWKLPEFPFAVVSSCDVNFCFVLGQNLLRKASLSIDFASNELLGNNQFAVKLGFPSKYSCTDKVSIMTISKQSTETEIPLITTLISQEKLREIQCRHRQLQTIIKLVQSGVSVSQLPKSCWQFKKVWSYLEIHQGLLLKREKDGTLVCVVPFSFLIDLTTEVHLQHTHIGIYKMVKMLRRLIWHKSLMKVIKDVCRTCSICQKCKISSRVIIPPTLRISTNSPFELVAMDLISLPTTSTGFVGCLMTVDHFSKWVTANPIRNKQSRTICKVLENNVLPTLPRVPVRILTDNGPEFISQEFGAVLERYNIVHVRTTPYKPSSNGAIERVNRTIGELLRILTSEPSKWDEHLAKSILTYNHTHHSEIACTPAEKILTQSYDITSLPLLSAEIRNPWAEGHPRYQPFKVGTLVLRKTILVGNLSTNKLLPRFDGPYQVTTVNQNNVTYELLHLEDGRVVRAHHVQLKAWCEPPNYLKKHFKYYGGDASLDLQAPEIPISKDPVHPVISESSDSSSTEDLVFRSDDLVRQVLSNALQNHFKLDKGKSPVKSIIKLTHTYERKQALRLWEEVPAGLDQTPTLLPIMDSESGSLALQLWEKMPSIENDLTLPLHPDLLTSSVRDEDSSSPPTTHPVIASTFIVEQPILSIEDWDVSSIESENTVDKMYKLLLMSSSEEDLDRGDSFSQPELEMFNTNPFQNPDGTVKDRAQLETEVDQLESSYHISFNEIVGDIWQVRSVSNTQLDFSGFSSRGVTEPNNNHSSQVASLVRTCQFLRETVRDIREARHSIEENRRLSRSRNIFQRRRLDFSPPFTRSRGKAVPLPNVQVRVLERRLRDE